MTAPDLAALEAAHKATTAGEWEAYDEHDLIEGAEPAWMIGINGEDGEWLRDLAETFGPDDEADATWIAMAHNAFPGILAHIKEQAAEITSKTRQLDYATSAYGDCAKIRDAQAARIAELEGQVARVEQAIHYTKTPMTGSEHYRHGYATGYEDAQNTVDRALKGEGE